jgi:predicted nicotinamide N-methyase
MPFGIGCGIKMPFDLQVQSRIFLGLYEIELNRHLRRMVVPGTACMDVGSQVGYYGLVCAKRANAPVVSIDADPWAIERMTDAIAANPELALCISLEHGTVGNGPDDVRLDDLAGRMPKTPGFVKIDIDGGEVDALQSGARLFREARPHVIVETHTLELERDCVRVLHDYGYRPRIVHQRTVLPDLRPVDHNRWLVAYGEPAQAL